MNTEHELKQLVRERYAKIAEQVKAENAASCCGATTPSNKVYNIMMDDYTGIKQEKNKVSLSNLQSQAAPCTPGSGCC